MSIQCGNLNTSQPYRAPQPVTGKALTGDGSSHFPSMWLCTSSIQTSFFSRFAEARLLYCPPSQSLLWSGNQKEWTKEVVSRLRDQWSIPVPVPHFHFKIPLSFCCSVPLKPVSLWRHQCLWLSQTAHSLHPYSPSWKVADEKIRYSVVRRLSLVPNPGRKSPVHTYPVRRRKHAGISLGALFYPDDGGNIFIRNISLLSSHCTVFHLRRFTPIRARILRTWNPTLRILSMKTMSSEVLTRNIVWGTEENHEESHWG
jgi:hypothetical protein